MTAAAAHLTVVITHWPDLADALTARQNSTWPPAMGITAAIRDQDDRDDAAELRALERNPEQLGVTAAPIRIDVYDTMRAVEADLVHLADVTAAQVQRTSMTHAPLHWPRRDREQRNLLADGDALDPRRWRYHGTRTAVQAAGWLIRRLDGQAGPFRRLTDDERARITRVASEAAERVERALEIARRSSSVDRPCPHCRGELVVSGGDGQPPMVRCENCGRTWTGQPAVA